MQKDTKPTTKPTQAFLRVSEIKEDTMIMDDGTMRAIVAVSSTNFDLKSEEEQNALIFSYQRFLNSLDFGIQIIMQSRRMEIGDYVEKLKELSSKQTNELLKVQTNEYIDFINKLVENANITNKSFYVVIPLSLSIYPQAASGGVLSSITKLFGGGGSTRELSQKLENFAKFKQMLEERVLSVTNNLSSVGLRAVRLRTEEVIELLYNTYNFGAGPLVDPSKLSDIKIIEN